MLEVSMPEEGETENLLGGGGTRSRSPPRASAAAPGSASKLPHHGAAAAAAYYSDLLKLVFGAGGIYAAFLYYGSLQEDVFRYTSPVDGTQFKQAWFLQVLEAAANIVVAYVGMKIQGATPAVPLKLFAISGASQVSSKACTSLALASGLSFPVATLAKSSKMAPVMGGTLLLGGATYGWRDYLQVAAIIGGTAIVSMGKKKSNSTENSSLGIMYICLALVFDGVTAGYQKRLQKDMAAVGVKPKPYDFMFWTNLFMCGTALLIAVGTTELFTGWQFVSANPEIFSKILQFSACSAIGQSFIFYTLAHFDPLVLSTVTTTRKIFSVLLSIFFKGHHLTWTGWMGVNLACLGILAEMQSKMSSKKGSKQHGKH